jgi:hypothetical protein
MKDGIHMKRKLHFLLVAFFVVVFLPACSPEQKTLGFFDPLRTAEELEHMCETEKETLNMLSENDLSNFVDRYDFSAVAPEVRINQLTDILWLNGQLLIADSDIDRGIHVLDSDLKHIDTIKRTPEHLMITPYVLAADDGGRLYAVINMSRGRGEYNFSIAVFDADLNYERAIPFSIKSDAEVLEPQSIAVNPNGGFYLALHGNDSHEDGKIYSITEDGTVAVVGGNKSFGYLLTDADNLYFVNGGFSYEFDSESGYFIGRSGISALYKLQNDTAVDTIVLPPYMHTPYREEEIAEWIDVWTEHFGEAPSELVLSSIYEGFNVPLTDGAGGLFRLKDDIAVVTKYSVMHVFDKELNYIYSNRLGEANNSAEELRRNLTEPGYKKVVAACADDEGNIYIAYRSVTNDRQYYGIFKGTPK